MLISRIGKMEIKLDKVGAKVSLLEFLLEATYEAVRSFMSKSEILFTVIRKGWTGEKATDADKCAKIYNKPLNCTTIVAISLRHLFFFKAYAGVMRRKQPRFH